MKGRGAGRGPSLTAEHLFSGATEAAHGPGRTQGTGATECQFEVTNAEPAGENAMGAPNNRPLGDGPGRSVEAGQDSDQDGRRDLQHRSQHVQWRGNRTGKVWKSCSVLWGLAVVRK